MKLSSKLGLTGTTFYYLALRLKSLARNFFLFWGRSDLPPPASKPNGFKKFVVHNLFSRRVAFGFEVTIQKDRFSQDLKWGRWLPPSSSLLAWVSLLQSHLSLGAITIEVQIIWVAQGRNYETGPLVFDKSRNSRSSLRGICFLSSSPSDLLGLFRNNLVKLIILGFLHMLVDMQITA